MVPLKMNTTYIKNKLLNITSADSIVNENEEKKLNQFLNAMGRDSLTQFHPASVLIPIVRSVDLAANVDADTAHWNIILTKRATHLKHHPGEISFPGGRFEQGDRDLGATATRETHEEIGILPDNVEILGELPKQKTISGYLVTPFVGHIKERFELVIDENEVDSAFEVPLDFVLNPDNHQRVKQVFAEQVFYFYEIQYKQHKIWGATARMLVNLSRILSV